MRTWFAVENSLVDRNDLGAYEKLCGMVLARYAGRPEFDHLLTTDIIAVKMGVPSEVALNALRGLVRKGLVDVDSASDLFVEGSENHIKDIELEELQDTHIIKSSSGKNSVQPVVFEDMDVQSEAPEDDFDIDNGFDNLDKLLAESSRSREDMPDHEGEDSSFEEASLKNSSLKKSSIENRVTEDVEDERDRDDLFAVKKPLPYNRGVASYKSNTAMKKKTGGLGPVPETADDTNTEVDPELLTRSIHEQSDSVRAWIEESDAVVSSMPKAPLSDREMLVTEVMEMIDEPINDRQARIILGLAEYDLEKVKKCYVVAQNTQVADKIDMLIHELQKKERPQPELRVPRTSQVDHAKLNQMKKYQAMKKNQV